ncbi:MAG: DEAD/DEAH box helicase [FCB group bacterium]|nr:DEAD/DEAH box helicase [FCB group bacterium]
MKFTDLNLPPHLAGAIKKMGFTDLTPIQEATYPIISSGKDLCAQAETGSGKTAACAIPLIPIIDVNQDTIQILVIVPTRELCLQYVEEIRKLAEGTKIEAMAIFGGIDKKMNVIRFKTAVHVLVATPGRLIDLMYDGVVSFPEVKCAILDEADELLKEGFLEDIEFIMSCIRSGHQTLLFSATMGRDTKHLVEELLHEPEYVTLTSKKASPASIEHYFMHVPPRKKMETLQAYLNVEKIRQMIIFCDSRNTVEKLHNDLRKTVKNIEFIHGGLTQNKRSSLFRRFKTGNLHCMIATDVAGRGLDFSHVTHIINWDFPSRLEKYTHRTGRAGRMGRKGVALTFITNKDLRTAESMIVRDHLGAVWLKQSSDGTFNETTELKTLHKPDQQIQGQGKQKKRPWNRRGKPTGNRPSLDKAVQKI